MARVVTFEVDNQMLPVLLDEEGISAVQLHTRGGTARLAEAGAKIEEALGGVRALLSKMIASVVEVTTPASVETTIKISLKFSASAGIVVADASTEGAMELSVKIKHGGDGG